MVWLNFIGLQGHKKFPVIQIVRRFNPEGSGGDGELVESERAAVFGRENWKERSPKALQSGCRALTLCSLSLCLKCAPLVPLLEIPQVRTLSKN